MIQPGLQNLPLELLQEIISYIPDLPFPFIKQPFPGSSPFLKEPLSKDEPTVQRTLTLRSLSQTCRMLRELVRPLAWEVIEVVSVRKERRKMATQSQKSELGYPQQLERDLWRQLRAVLEDEKLRKNLRRVSVIITDSSAQAALKMFEAFPTFSNLHTIQLFSLPASSATLWEQKLSPSLCNLNTPLRSVKNLVLPEYAKGLLRHCPSLETIVATLGPRAGSFPYIGKDPRREILTEILDHCPSVKLIRGLPMKWPTDAESIVKGCPQLTCLCFDDTLSYGFNGSEGGHQQLWKRTFQQLSVLKQIRHITLVVDVSGPFEIFQWDQLSIMHGIMLLGGVSGAELEEYQDNEDVGNPFTSPFPTALLPLWFLKKIIPREVASDQMNDIPQDHGSARTLTVDIAGFKRPVAIFSIAPPEEGDAWPRLLSMRVGYRSNEAFEELYDLIDIPLNIDQQPDPSSNLELARPLVFCDDSDSDECDFPGSPGALFR